MNSEIIRSIASCVDAVHPIIYINHFDFYEVDQDIKKIDPTAQCYEFIPAVGEVDFDHNNKSIKNPCSLTEFLYDVYERIIAEFCDNQDARIVQDQNYFILLKNIHRQINDIEVITWLTRIAERNLHDDNFNVTIFIISPILAIPPELENFITVFDNPLPSTKEIRAQLDKFAAKQSTTIEPKLHNELALALKGLNEFQISQILNLAFQNGGSFDESDKALIVREKQGMIKKAGLLELINVTGSIDDVGGLNSLKRWLSVKAKIFKNLESALRFGVDVPKGVMIIGIPGCGKSLAAKATASLFELPLVRLDIGRLMGKYVGESENNMRRALELAESMSPCVLWVDELEKAFAGLNSNSSGGGNEVTVRLFGHFLTWLQEKTSPVFIVATANDVSSLPPEFLRKGRFDELFFVDLPEEAERAQILEVHLKKRKQLRSSLDLPYIAKLTDGFNGADLEAVVKEAIEQIFISNQKHLVTTDLINAVNKIKPISRSLKDKIDELRNIKNTMEIVSAQ